MANKRKRIICFIAFLLSLIYFVLGACGCVQGLQNAKPKVYEGFSVHYLDVGQGDCIFIRLPNGINVLIDTGETDEYNSTARKISDYLNCYSVTQIDYLVLTHLDSDHVGNAQYIINNFNVKIAFVPYVSEVLLSAYPHYQRVYKSLIDKQVQIKISDCYQRIVGQNYALVFLSPTPKNASDSSYFHFNGMKVPDEQACNDLSPIIYLECMGSRFLFTGDSTNKQEKLVLNNYFVGLYDKITSKDNIKVNLSQIDYLKVGHHGANTSSCEEFLSVVKPKNAIISVGGNNFYGHPKTEVLHRLSQSNFENKLYRTDYHGNIVVHETQGGTLSVSTDLDN